MATLNNQKQWDRWVSGVKSTIFLSFAFLLVFTLACTKGIDVSDVAQVNANNGGFGPNFNPGDDDAFNPGINTGGKLLLDFPIDDSNDELNGPLLEGVDGSMTTFRVRFVPGNEQLPGGVTGPATNLTDLTITASEIYGGLTIAPFITEQNMSGNEATFKITVPDLGRHDKTKAIKITALGQDSGGANILRSTVVMVNTTTILTTNPEFEITTTINFPDLNPATTDIVRIRLFRSTLNSDLRVTGIGELINDGQFSESDLPFRFPLFGEQILGGGQNPKLNSFPVDVDFPAGVSQDIPGQKILMHNFCVETTITPDLQNLVGEIKCANGAIVQAEPDGLAGLLFEVIGFNTGIATTPILPTAPERGLELNLTQVTTAIDLDESTIDAVRMRIFNATTQPDLSLAGKLELIFTPQVDPSEPPVIVDFSTQPVDLVNLQTVSNPISLRTPAGMLEDLGFSVDINNVQILLNLTSDFQLSFGSVLPGGSASTPLANFDLEGASFGTMANPPVCPDDPRIAIDFQELWVLGLTGNGTNLVATFTPGTSSGSPSTVTNATITPLGLDADKVVLEKTSLTASDFAGNVALVSVDIADGVNISQTTIVGFKIEGTDSAGRPFKGYSGLTLKRTGPQPALPIPPPFELVQYSLCPDIVLSTADILRFETDMTSQYGDPGEIIMSGTATLFDPPGVDLTIPVTSIFNGKTLAITTTPINIEVPQGALLDLTGVAGIEIQNVGFQGQLTPDLKTGGMTILPGGQALLPNGVVQDVVAAAFLKLTVDIQQGPDDPQLNLDFSVNPVIYGISNPSSETDLMLEFIPGNDGGSPTTLTDITCTADHDFDALTTTNFASVADFDALGFAEFNVQPPVDYVPAEGDYILVYCDATDSAGNHATAGGFLVYSKSPFQDPTALPDVIIESFNTDPETNPITPPAGVFAFPGDGVRFLVSNQLLFPGVDSPTTTATTTLTHYTKTTGPTTAIWKEYEGINFGGQLFSIPITNTLDLNDLTLRSTPIGVGDTCNPGDFGLVPGGPVCFPAGEALEDIQLGGNPPNLVIPFENFAIAGAFSSDLRSLSVTSALSCAAFLACDGVNTCPFPSPFYGQPCSPTDVNPNPFGVGSRVHGLPAISIFVPLNSFGFGFQVDP